MVGYDPLNEPFPGNFYKDPKIMIPGHFDKTRLEPMFGKIYEALQESSEDNSMWFEPCQVPDTAGLYPVVDKAFHVGFEKPPGAEIGSSKHVLNDHAYCCTMGPEVCDIGEPNPKYASQCEKWHEKKFTLRQEDAKRLGVPFFMSEFGACLTEGPCTTEITQVTEQSDRLLAGWSYW